MVHVANRMNRSSKWWHVPLLIIHYPLDYMVSSVFHPQSSSKIQGNHFHTIYVALITQFENIISKKVVQNK